ncbi:hypothetical protein BU14_0146s0012 [Porphyra umbilicalis]|uniref:ATP-dependent DNA helicase n=1 Tax=Porphyra umbilicalis TaxID=2786 RepID=A0A1X6P9E9_PORUM|nr:hypothetical protein BU14_0146s0012 [Porphyra umbilicalis]|eukprot:OSX77521.1 hypothetical protein BU14_0146s0012 [Porphyra umbilicalis]
MFETKDAADLWAAEGADAGALPSSLSSPTPSPHSFEEGSLLRTVSAAGEAMYDLADCSSASSFFVAIGAATYSAGVRAQGVALTRGGIPDQPPDVRKRRRLEAAAHGAQAATHACATVNLPATAPAGLSAGRGATLSSFPAVGEAVSLGKRGPSRPLVSWSYSGAGRTTKGGKDKDRSPRLHVATPPTDVAVPLEMSGAALRTYELLAGGTSVFLTGPPGCGKTYVANRVIGALRDAGQVVAACGSSRVAAALVGGITVHSWAGFCNGDADVASPLDVILRKVIPLSAKTRMCTAMALVVDEVGTLSAAFLTRLDLVLRAVRRRATPFGRLTVLFVGDFLQLAPPKGQFAFLSDVWGLVFSDLALVLATNWRHVRDDGLLGLLLRLRAGQAAKNEDELQRLPGKLVRFEATDKAVASYLTGSKASALLDTTVKYVRVLCLRVGAMVAVPTGCLAAQGVPCGSRGVVLSFFMVGARVFPRVCFSLASGGTKTVVVLPATAHAVALDGWSRAATRTQVPLVLAWAATIHAAQGWTLPEVAVDLSKAFAAGQALSGLSRTPTLEGLHLVGFDESKIIVDGVALAFHEGLHAYE